MEFVRTYGEWWLQSEILQECEDGVVLDKYDIVLRMETMP